jgi:hypothetical protein
MLVILVLVIPMLGIFMLVIPSLEKSNKFEVLLFINALVDMLMSKHKNLKLDEIQWRAPLFMVLRKKLEISSWRIHNTINCQKWIINEKVMALQSVHGQKVEKMPHPTLENCFENT